jgi:hypothetical protein
MVCDYRTDGRGVGKFCDRFKFRKYLIGVEKDDGKIKRDSSLPGRCP